ncbi:enoyl-CoA hydratase-related protein [Aureimonas sp. AU4]|uniref:enoyl-CoA hydratase-related protein n=1 Tax=Aureimonas sp. AU4 TaxID=1638163 RepID=UPI0009E67C2E|nr:enoyl-CoA hydratase-related protein [Aureimonas sp. AU4]
MSDTLQRPVVDRPTPMLAPVGVADAIRALAGDLPQVDISFEPALSLLWIDLAPEPKPVFTMECIASVAAVQEAVMAHNLGGPLEPVRFLAYRAKGEVFSLGGDLDYYLGCLARGDRQGLERYARLATQVIELNTNGLRGQVITLSTVHARALGGGIDPARACNVMVAEERASFSYPEVHYNHFPISAVPVLIRRAGAIEAERILTSGDVYAPEEFLAKGVLDAVVPAGDGEDWLRRYAEKAATSHRARVMLFEAFNRRFGDLRADLADAAALWVDHIMSLSAVEVAKLQRIANAQNRMLSRRGRDAAAA